MFLQADWSIGVRIARVFGLQYNRCYYYCCMIINNCGVEFMGYLIAVLN